MGKGELGLSKRRKRTRLCPSDGLPCPPPWLGSGEEEVLGEDGDGWREGMVWWFLYGEEKKKKLCIAMEASAESSFLCLAAARNKKACCSPRGFW
jgi:hypothetical protein